jgi:hypothetical protein
VLDNKSLLSVAVETLKEIFLGTDPFFVGKEITLSQYLKDKKCLFGFHLQTDGVEIYNIFEEHWLVIADYSKSSLSPLDWHQNKFKKAIECIPKNDVIINLVSETAAFSFNHPFLPPLFSIHSGIKALVSYQNGSHLEVRTPAQTILTAHEFIFETEKKQLIIKGIDRNKHPLHQVFYHFLKKKD